MSSALQALKNAALRFVAVGVMKALHFAIRWAVHVVLVLGFTDPISTAALCVCAAGVRMPLTVHHSAAEKIGA